MHTKAFILYIILVGAIVYLLYLCYQYIHKQIDNWKRRKFLDQYEPLARTAIAELDKYTLPSSRFTDEQLQTFQKSYLSLADVLTNSAYSSKDTALFLSKYGQLKEIQQANQEENDKYTQAVSLAQHLNKDFAELRKPTAYLNHHRIEMFELKWKGQIRLIQDYLIHFTSKELNDSTKRTLAYLTGQKDLNELAKTQNAVFVNSELEQHQDYFDKLFRYPLDDQQRRAVVTSEDNNLIIASAGSGKTSTIIAKTQYLIEKCGIKPREILVVTYTRKAAEELQTRMGYDDVTCSTFHAHALKSIGRITGHTPNLCDNTLLAQKFDYLLRKNPEFFAAANRYAAEIENRTLYDYQYETAEQHALDLQRYGKSAPYADMDGNRVFVRSREERELCIILTELGVPFRYEESYPYDTTDKKHRQYKPDFTIHYTDFVETENGVELQERTVYMEHFGIDAYSNVPKWFGEGQRGGWQSANRTYNEGIMWKKQLHREHGTKLLFTTSADFQREGANMRNYVENMLRQNGVPVQPLSDERKRELLKQMNTRVDESLAEFLNGFIVLMKANRKTLKEIADEVENEHNVALRERNKFILEQLITPLYQSYAQALAAHNQIDFTDLLLDCADLYETQNPYRYKYILVDEFQDMSKDKYLYLQALRSQEPFTQLFCVGDDWQSIYRFSGSDMTLFYDFEKAFGVTERCKIETTHRFGNPLMRVTSEFVQANPEQQRKDIRTTATTNTEINLIPYKEDEQLEKLTSLIKAIPQDETVYILGRYKSNIPVVTGKALDFAKDVVLKIGGHDVRYLTIHSSKGLEADHVFVVDCNDGAMPSIIEDDPILSYVLSGADSFEDAEERRVFYVAMTRARKATYLLYNIDKPSYFIGELGEYRRTKNSTDVKCPHCNRGYVAVTQNTKTKTGNRYINVVCTNRNCDYHETLFSDSSDIYRYIPRTASFVTFAPDYKKIMQQCNKNSLLKEYRLYQMSNDTTHIAYYFYIPTSIDIETFKPKDLATRRYAFGIAHIENYYCFLNCIIPLTETEQLLEGDKLKTLQKEIVISDKEYNEATNLIQKLAYNSKLFIPEDNPAQVELNRIIENA